MDWRTDYGYRVARCCWKMGDILAVLLSCERRSIIQWGSLQNYVESCNLRRIVKSSSCMCELAA